MAPIYPFQPYYLSWQQGIELAGWKVISLYRIFSEIDIVDQLFLYFFLCTKVKVVHLNDLDLQTLFATWNSIRSRLSLLTVRLMIWWPRILRKRIIYSFGNVTPHEYDNPAERLRHQIICSSVQDVTSLSPSMANGLVQIGIPEQRIWPLEHADIADYFHFPKDWLPLREKYHIPADAVVLLVIGTIRPYKGIENAIEAFKKTVDPQLRLFITGMPSAGYTEQHIQELVAGEGRIILGPLRLLSNEEMGWMFQDSDYCLLTYRGIDHSGLICQSLGLGVPVIAARVGTLPDYLKNGAGILFAPGDTDELAHILDNLRSFDRSRAQAAGLAIMRARSPERIGRRLVKLYEYRRGGPQPEKEWLF
jgi:glycosyltransferase involved in cell wall biosynthesis